MAIDLTLKSVAITNREATPKVANDSGDGGPGRVKSVKSILASVPASLSITSIIRMVEVPSNAYITALNVQSAAQAAGMFDLGVYRTNTDGGAVVDQNFFASALDFGTAYVKTDVLNESTTNTTAKQQQQLWKALGESVDPHSTYDICLVCVTENVITGAGAVSVEAQYV